MPFLLFSVSCWLVFLALGSDDSSDAPFAHISILITVVELSVARRVLRSVSVARTRTSWTERPRAGGTQEWKCEGRGGSDVWTMLKCRKCGTTMFEKGQKIVEER